ncbi:propanediol utilization protein [Suicoccus acidiformans]|uniref:Propanediol utilization protein n=1 Tax=Suicoccus acidiformans TaxID=2036206 RepID=A0A347WNV4_9LACT|nr:BMC domain-containing protein [Suicoccus acidiformans]AXY26761.1 propanediol utilization protein [Suicoccus acidiformans]
MSHVIAGPDERVFDKLGFDRKDGVSALGIYTVTPGEAAIIAADIAKKTGEVEIGYVDRFSGSMIIMGDVSSVQTALQSANNFLSTNLGFATSAITRT